MVSQRMIWATGSLEHHVVGEFSNARQHNEDLVL